MNKKYVFGIALFLLAVLLVLPLVKTQFNKQDNQSPKEMEKTDKYEDHDILIVYYSKSNTTKRVANLLQKMLNSDIYEIEVVDEYPESMVDIASRAKSERENNLLPKIKGELPDISKYDYVLIGGPVWSRTVSTPVMSYLEKTDFDGKKVSPFWTDIGKPGNYEDDFTNLVINGSVQSGLELTDASELSDETIEKELANWLDDLFE